MFFFFFSGGSVQKLIERPNSDIGYPSFCDIHLGIKRLTNSKIVSDIHCEPSTNLRITDLEKVRCTNWMPFIEEPKKNCC